MAGYARESSIGWAGRERGGGGGERAVGDSTKKDAAE